MGLHSATAVKRTHSWQPYGNYRAVTHEALLAFDREGVAHIIDVITDSLQRSLAAALEEQGVTPDWSTLSVEHHRGGLNDDPLMQMDYITAKVQGYGPTRTYSESASISV